MLIGGIDIGTTGAKITVFDGDGSFIYSSYAEYDVIRKGGEHTIDAETVWNAVLKIMKDSASHTGKVDTLGVTTFGETFVLLDENDKVLFPSMLYTDLRGAEELSEIVAHYGERHIAEITGAKPHTMYSLPKLMYIRNHHPDIYKKVKRVLLIEDFIIYMLTGKAKIEYSLAQRTLFFDIRKKCWCDELLSGCGIDKALLSECVPTGSPVGKIKPDIARATGFSPETNIICGAHDQVAAAIGTGAFDVGTAADGMGTVECVTPVIDGIPDVDFTLNGGYSVVPYIFDGSYVCYSVGFSCGAALKWFRNELSSYDGKSESFYADCDKNVPQNPTGILVLPHFAGAGNPHMNPSAKCAMYGLTLETTRYDIYKALMEGVSYDAKINLELFSKYGIKIKKLSAAGGGAASPVWVSIKSDIYDLPITSLEVKETGTVGTCMLAAVAAGIYPDVRTAASHFIREKRTFTPDKEKFERYAELYSEYKKLFYPEML